MAPESRQMDLKGKTAAVTGGNSGIGLATATALAQAGSRIAVAARDQKRNLAVADELAREYDVQALAVETDVSREADCEHLIRRTVAKFGTLDVLVNNAGISGGSIIAKTETEDFARVLKTNLYGAFWCARAAYRQMQKTKGNPCGAIINISSVAGKQAWKGTGTY